VKALNSSDQKIASGVLRFKQTQGQVAGFETKKNKESLA
jgi:hypothetical protein